MKFLLMSAWLCGAVVGCSTQDTAKDNSDTKAAANVAAEVKSLPTTRPTTAPSTQAAGKPINKFCPINRDEEIDSTVTYVYKGKTIGFCCDSCIPKFKKNPEKYMKDLK